MFIDWNQIMIDMIRRYAYPWPGKEEGKSVICRYPNLLAEVAASPTEFAYRAKAARVSTKIFAAVLEDGEELTAMELIRSTSNRSYGYLAFPTLQMVDGSTRKGRVRYRELRDLWEEAYYDLPLGDHKLIRAYISLLKAKQQIPFALWRHSCERCSWFISEREERNKPVRTARLT